MENDKWWDLLPIGSTLKTIDLDRGYAEFFIPDLNKSWFVDLWTDQLFKTFKQWVFSTLQS